MRQYRAIPIDGKDFVYGWYAEVESKHFILTDRCSLDYEEHDEGYLVFFRGIIEVIPKTVGQSPGLKDKNSTEIYEGDILRWDKTGYCAPVSYDGGWFVLNSEPIMCYVEEAVNDDEFDTTKDCRNSEVIGNIHQNPELEKGDKQ